jgi:hypothetical protein
LIPVLVNFVTAVMMEDVDTNSNRIGLWKDDVSHYIHVL